MKYFNSGKSDNCAEFRDHIREFLDGSLDEAVHTRLETHRLDCPVCKKAVEEEQKVMALMSEVPDVGVPVDFRDRVLRAWRLRRESVKESFPAASLKRIQLITSVIVVILLLLPMARVSLITAASRLMGALDRLPPEYRGGIDVTFSVPTWAEMVATVQVWQGRLFESMGEMGSAITPWSGWLWATLILVAMLVVVNFLYLKSRLPAGPVQDHN